MKLTLAPNEFLDGYVLGCEFARNADISGNAYLFWSGAISAKYENSRTVFLHKKSIPARFQEAAELCSITMCVKLSSDYNTPHHPRRPA